MSISQKDLQEVKDVFFKDPRWKTVEELILEYITPLLDMTTVDTSQPAEAVKAEIIGRRIAHERLSSFISQVGIIGQSKPQVINSPFR